MALKERLKECVGTPPNEYELMLWDLGKIVQAAITYKRRCNPISFKCVEEAFAQHDRYI